MPRSISSSPIWIIRHCGLLSLGNSLLDLVNLGVQSVIDSLLSNHDSESLEISEILLGFTGSQLLSPGGLLESGNNTGLLKSLSDNSGASSAADVDLEVREGEPADGHHLSLDS